MPPSGFELENLSSPRLRGVRTTATETHGTHAACRRVGDELQGLVARSVYMDLREAAGGRERLVRTLLAVGLTVVAASSLRKGRRLNGLLAGGGALLLGYTAATRPRELTEIIDVGATDEDAEFRCAVCGEPIVPGQSRGPNENNEIVHETCKDPAE